MVAVGNIICGKCAITAPHTDANLLFCVNCGHPVMQPCPYEDFYSGTRLPLVTERGTPPGFCPNPDCGKLFKVCRECKRLHKLDEPRCLTPSCREQRLYESAEAFPTPHGPVDGTRSVGWRGGFSLEQKLPPLDVPAFRLLAFRYGLLVGVTSQSMHAYMWTVTGWKAKAPVPLRPSGQLAVKSLVLDGGYAFIQAEGCSLAISLSAMEVEKTLEERAVLQSKGERWWARVIQDGNSARLALMDYQAGVKQTPVRLPGLASEIVDMVVANRVFLATQQYGILSVDPETGESEVLTLPQHRWVRLAVADKRLLAVGFDSNGKCVLCLVNSDGRSPELKNLGNDYIPDFAWGNHAVYTARFAVMETYSDNAILQSPEYTTKLPAAQETQGGFLALFDAHAGVRLLTHRKEQIKSSLFLVDPHSGQSTQVGSLQIGELLYCIADSRIVVLSQEGSVSKLRTYGAKEIK